MRRECIEIAGRISEYRPFRWSRRKSLRERVTLSHWEKGEILAGSHGYYVRTSAYDFLGHFIVLASIVRQWNSCLHSSNPVTETSVYQILYFNSLSYSKLIYMCTYFSIILFVILYYIIYLFTLLPNQLIINGTLCLYSLNPVTETSVYQILYFNSLSYSKLIYMVLILLIYLLYYRII